jgi:hypothetical protein
MTQQMDAFLRDFIGYDENQIANLDIEREPAGLLSRTWSTKLLMEP